jgi:hypothetical protein
MLGDEVPSEIFQRIRWWCPLFIAHELKRKHDLFADYASRHPGKTYYRSGDVELAHRRDATRRDAVVAMHALLFAH